MPRDIKDMQIFFLRLKDFDKKHANLHFREFRTAFSKIRYRIDRIKKESKRINKYYARDYNIFNVLKIHKDEDRTHSPFLANLLNPNGEHGQGEIFVKAFLEYLSKKKKVGIPKEGSWDNWHIKTEDYIQNDNESRGFMDIVLRNYRHGILIVIENKIYALEDPYQLEKYCRHMQDETGFQYRILLYLTRDGREPNNPPINRDVQFNLLSYNEDIKTILEQSKDQIKARKIKDIVEQYLEIIEIFKRR